MSSSTLLISLFQYKSWADQGLLALLNDASKKYSAEKLDTALRVLNHAHVVDRIFSYNLQKLEHSYKNTNTTDTPTLSDLSKSVTETDKWYIQYVSRLGACRT